MNTYKSLNIVKELVRKAGLFHQAKLALKFLLQVLPGSIANRLRVAIEKANYSQDTEVHDLPRIFDYWAQKYLVPKITAHGFSDIDDFFVKKLRECFDEGPARTLRFLSIGAGNCDLEVRISQALKQSGHADFVFECLDFNEQMLARGRALARQRGLEAQLLTTVGDFNQWVPVHSYDAVIANQSLHHVVALESLFDAIKGSLAEGGRFLVSDMIGRNGHARWPEALDIVEAFWRELPASQRFNHLLKKQESAFINWDCSQTSFEGIRAQDILPLLVERFEFDFFMGFSNVIFPFIDRAFGPGFDPDKDADRDFIDRIQARDEAEIRSGRIKPTQMIAALTLGPAASNIFADGISPTSAIRRC